MVGEGGKNCGERENGEQRVTSVLVINNVINKDSRSRFGKSVVFIFPLHRDYCTVDIKEIINVFLYMITLWISASNYK